MVSHATLEMPTIRLPKIKEAKNARSWWTAILTAVAASAASVILHLWMLMALAPAGSPGLWARVMSWDADLYHQIAQYDYPAALTYEPKAPHVLQGSNLAFSPLYPMLEHLAQNITGSWTGAAMLVSWGSLVVCLALVHRLATDLYGPAAALPAVILVGCAQPMALVFSLGYPDGGLYLSLGLAAMLCARSKHWLWAGAFASLAGLARPTGVAVTVAVGCMALAAWRESDYEHKLFMVAGSLLGCLGTPAYLIWVGLRVHQMNAWFAVQQAGWGTHWDWGSSFWQFLTTSALHANGLDPMVDIVTVLGIFAYTVFSVHSGHRSELGAMAAWPLVVLVLTVGQSNYTCVKLRLLLAAGICLLPLAKRLTTWSSAARWSFLVAATLMSCWWGYAMLNVWHWAL